MEIKITFPGGERVDAEFKERVINTDQLPKRGGEGSAPEPFQLFLASIGTCAGIYVKRFCDARDIPTDNIQLIQRHEVDPMGSDLARITLDIQVPRDFPEKYHDALVRAADKCPVKRAIFDPPDIDINTVVI